jgi:hypothetical protein
MPSSWSSYDDDDPGEMMVISNYITVASFGWIGTRVRPLDPSLSCDDRSVHGLGLLHLFASSKLQTDPQ